MRKGCISTGRAPSPIPPRLRRAHGRRRSQHALATRGLRRGGEWGRRDDHHARRDGGCLFRPPRERQGSRGHHVAGHLRLEAGFPRDGRSARRAGLRRAGAQPVLPRRQGNRGQRGRGLSAAVQRLLPYMRNITPEAVVTDATAFAGWLDGQEAVDTSKKLGVVGFCMSGSYTIRAAAALPDRVGAAASLHGAGVATDAPDSPHLLAPKTKAQFLFAIARNDDAEDPEFEEPPQGGVRRQGRGRGLPGGTRLGPAGLSALRRSAGGEGVGQAARALRRRADLASLKVRTLVGLSGGKEVSLRLSA